MDRGRRSTRRRVLPDAPKKSAVAGATRRQNPKRPHLGRARSAYAEFQGRDGKRVIRSRVSPVPETLAKLGELEAVVYRTAKHGAARASYEHEFGETGKKRPILAMDPRNKRLHIVGGGYTVTGRGIED